MLSIGRVERGTSAKEYYLDLRGGDYYTGRGNSEAPGEWYGKLADVFGLSGQVRREEFCKLFNGRSLTGENLRRRQSNERPAFDLTFSAPKDLSIIYALAGPKLKREIDVAMSEAAKAGMRYVQDEACKTRLGQGGAKVVEGGGLAAALFPHDASRELDPQYHIHALVFNFTKGPDGKFRSLDASKFYQHKHAAGAIFRAELAARLATLGFVIERDSFSFSIRGVPPELSDELSKRAKQIEAKLREKGKAPTPKAKDEAALKSRRAKQLVDHDQLVEQWLEVAKRYGFTRPAEQVEELRTYVKPKGWDETAERQAAMREALKQLTSSASAFTEKRLIEQTAVEAQTRGLCASQVRLEVFFELERARRRKEDSQVVRIGEHRDGYERFTTRELFELEKEIIRIAERRRQSREHRVSDVSLAAALAAKPTLRDEQVKAVLRVTQNFGNVQCVRGWAGTGKTFMLDAARLAWERDGYKVYGAALSGKAAAELARGANIRSATIAKWIYDLDRQGRKDRLTLDSKTILVVDEAGMVGTRQLHRLMTEVERAGARLVLVGDEKQLQSIDAGGGFFGLSKRLGYAELKEITRQRDAADRQAVYDLADGMPQAALKSYAERERLVVGEDRANTMERLVADWCRDKTDLKEKLILSSTNRQAATLNQLCQEERHRRGELGRECLAVRDGAEVHAGDRVLFRRNDKRFGVHNGDLATVIEVTTADKSARRAGESVTVKLDSGEAVTVPLSKSKSQSAYDTNNLSLGYCVTTHKSQGATVENTYVFLYGAMTDQQMAYVQVSRARDTTRIYTTDDEAGPELSHLTQAMSRDRRKTMAHDAIDGVSSTSPSTSTEVRQKRGLRIKLGHEI